MGAIVGLFHVVDVPLVTVVSVAVVDVACETRAYRNSK